MPNYKGVYAVDDCAHIIDPNTGSAYAPTAQHTIREGTIAANNIIASIEGRSEDRILFDYKTKGMMGSIGKRTGIGNLLGSISELTALLIICTDYIGKDLQKVIQTGAVLIDEAGLISLDKMGILFSSLRDNNPKIIVIGDDKQHHLMIM